MSPSATDVITYIGVPLAVLGVLPILYNTAVTLAALSKIKRALRHSRLTALTRSDIVNRIIEVDLPRYAVTPLDRFTHRDEYWALSHRPSLIPGGSWTTFNWRANTIGLKTQRVEFVDQLRQPQVDVAFDELICYLLDLGATLDPHGWRLLRSSGLWTPAGCSLMRSPDGTKNALTIAPLDDSDGHLSLTVRWEGHWTTRDYSHLPPYWVCLPPPPDKTNGEVGEASSSSSVRGVDAVNRDIKDKEDGDNKALSVGNAPSLDSVERAGKKIATLPITCQISEDGIVSALTQEEDDLQNDINVRLDHLHIEHLRVRRSTSDGVWFASAVTAYGTSSQTILWNYKIPDDLLTFTRRETVPCGVLVLLGAVTESETPEWSTQNDSYESLRGHELFVRRDRERRDAVAAEAHMSPPQREGAQRDRLRRENEQRIQDMIEKTRLTTKRNDTRTKEALQSPKWDNKRVAEYQLTWLKARDEIPRDQTMKDAVGALLHRMVLDGQFTTSLCQMLNLWKLWADNAGMRRSDLDALKGAPVVFAQATLLVSVLRDTWTAPEGNTLSMDLQECLRIWRMVRLG